MDGDGKFEHAVMAFHILLLAHADESSLTEAAISLLQTQIARLLQLEVEVELAKQLMAYGLDPLVAVDLCIWVRQSFGADLSTLDVINASSLVALSKKLVSKLTGLQGTENEKGDICKGSVEIFRPISMLVTSLSFMFLY